MNYENFMLKCGHEGNIVWRSSDGRTMGVRGTKRGCDVCGIEREKGWTFTVHLLDLSGCSLCDLVEKGEGVTYRDDLCLFVIGRSRKVPMGVAKIHGMPVEEKVKAHLEKKAYELYGDDIKITAPMRSAPYHYHIHVYKEEG